MKTNNYKKPENKMNMKTPKLRSTEIVSFGYSFIAVHDIYFDGKWFPVVDLIDDIDLHSETWRKRLAKDLCYQVFNFDVHDINGMFKSYHEWKDICFCPMYEHLKSSGLDDWHDWQLAAISHLFYKINDGQFSNEDRKLIMY